MTSFLFRYRMVGICASAVMLAACGGSQPLIGAPGALPQSRSIAQHPERGGSWILPEAEVGASYKTSGPLLYVVNHLYNDVTVYHAVSKDAVPIATISHDLSAPNGDCLDSRGTLYVTSRWFSTGWISEYPLGKTKASVSIKVDNTPWFCAIDRNDNLWVTSVGNPNNVTEYLYGSKKPHFVITKGMVAPAGIAIDRSGNLYVANRGASNSYIDVYPPGSKTPSRTITEGVTSPVGIGVDSSSTLYVANAYTGNVEEYLSGHNRPYREITQTLDFPVGLVVNSKGWLYVTNQGSSNNVVEFPPNSVRPSKRQISRGIDGAIGVAYYPPLLP